MSWIGSPDTVIACDDGRVRKLGKGHTIASCVRWRLNAGIEDFAFLPITVDGLDATSILSYMVRKLSYPSGVEAILLDSITIAGFNIVSPDTLYKTSGAPVVIVYTYRPSYARLARALEAANLPYKDVRMRVLRLVDYTYRADTRLGPVYIVEWPQRGGRLWRIVEKYQVRDRKPAPVRAAHYISSSLSNLLITS